MVQNQISPLGYVPPDPIKPIASLVHGLKPCGWSRCQGNVFINVQLYKCVLTRSVMLSVQVNRILVFVALALQ